MRGMWKRIVSIVLVCAMLAGYVPVEVMATGVEEAAGAYLYEDGKYTLKYTWNQLIEKKYITVNGTTLSSGNSGVYGGNSYKLVIKDGITDITGRMNIGLEWHEIVIPASVRNIESGAFAGVKTLRRIIVNDRNEIYDSRNDCNAIIETYSNTLIAGCKNTKIQEGIEVIAQDAFYGCLGLQEIVIPSSVKKIYPTAFARTGLENICVEDGNLVYDSRNDCNAIIESESNTLIVGCKDTKVPENVLEIGEYAFYECTGLREIVLPNSVKTIGKYAFDECELLEQITFSNTLKAIKTYSFSGCTELKDIILPESVETIGAYAFQGCRELTEVTLPENIETIEKNVFEYCTQLTDVVLGEKIKNIKECAFFSCFKLKNIKLPENLETIGPHAFSYCKELEKIVIPNNVSNIDLCVFNGTGLKSILVNSGNLIYDSRENCNAIIETESNSLITGCITTKIPESIVEIASCSFANCEELIEVEIPKGVKWIGGSAFANCEKLATVKLQEGLEGITLSAFAFCDNLNNITVPKSVLEIENDGFSTPPFENVPLIHNLSSAEGSPWGAKEVHNFAQNNCPLCKTGDFLLDNQTTTYYSIRCEGDNPTYYTRGFTVNVGDESYTTEDKYVAEMNVPLEKSNQVSIEKEGYFKCDIPQELVYTYHHVKMYPDDTETPFINFIAGKQTEENMYKDLRISPIDVLEGSPQTYDLYVDINWNSFEEGSVYLQHGKTIVPLSEGSNKEVCLAEYLVDSEQDTYLCYTSKDGQVWKQKIHLVVRKVEFSEIKIDGGQSVSGKNSVSEEEDKVWGNMKLSFYLFTESLPVEVKLDAVSPTTGTFKGTVGIKYSEKESADAEDFAELKEKAYKEIKEICGNKESDYNAIEKIKRSILTGGRTLETQENMFIVNNKVEFLGYIEGTYDLTKKGELDNIEITESGVLTTLFNVDHAITRQYVSVTPMGPFPWFWEFIFKVKLGLKLNFMHEYDGTKASIAPVESNDSSVGIELGVAAGVNDIASVGAAGEGMAYLDGQILPFDISKLNIYADLKGKLFTYEIGPWVSGELFEFKSDKYYLIKDGKFFEGEVDKSNGDARIKSLSVYSLPNEDTMEQTSRDYLKSESEFVANNSMKAYSRSVTDELAAASVIKTNTYTFTDPQIVNLSGGKKLMVWVDDPGEEIRPVDLNRSALYYSYFDENGWSNPKMVSDDGTADSHPTLREIDNEAYLVWINENKEFSEDGTFEEYCEAMDIAYARFDENECEFVDVSNVQTNSMADTLPDVTVMDGKPTVVWMQNSENNIMQTTGTNTLFMASFTGDTWDVHKMFSDDLSVDGLCAVTENEKCVVYVSKDMDGDYATVDDKEILKISQSGSEQITNDDVIDTKPKMINGSVYWYKNGMITDGKNEISVEGGSDRYCVAVDGEKSTILYAKYNEDESTVIYGNYYDGVSWSDPIIILETDKYISDFDCICNSEGALEIVTNEISIVNDNYEETTLKYYAVEKKTDLTLSEVVYDKQTLEPGKEFVVTGYLKNEGTQTIDDIEVSVLYEGETLAKETKEVNLLVSEESTVDIMCTLPEVLNTNEIELEVYPMNQTDYDLSDNKNMCQLNMNDVSVENIEVQKNSESTVVSAYISNCGREELNNVEVSVYTNEPEGEPIATQVIPTILVEQGEYISFDTNIEAGTVVYVVATDMEDENYYSNNKGFTIVTHPNEEYTPRPIVELNKKKIELEAEETFQLSANVSDEDSNVKDFKWESSDPNVVMVDENGKITAVSRGTAKVSVEYLGFAKVFCFVTVTNSAYKVSSVDELESPHNYGNNSNDYWIYTSKEAQDIEEPVLAVTFDERTYMEDFWDTLYIYDGNGKRVGSYTGGELAGETVYVSGDTVKIQLKSDNQGTKWGFKVTDIKVVQDIITLNKKSIKLEGDETYQLTATVAESFEGKLKWTSSNTEVAEVDETGKVTAKAKGTARISVETESGGCAIKYCEVTVTNTIHKVSSIDELESTHNYANNAEEWWIYISDEAKELINPVMKVTFDDQSSTEDGCDHLAIYDENDNMIGTYTGEELAGVEIEVPGSVLKICLTSDDDYTYWGFKVTNIIVEGDAKYENPFSDVFEYDWFYDAVLYVNHQGVMSGDSGLFRPNDSMTRAMMVTTLYRIEDKPKVTEYKATEVFGDVEKGLWYEDAVNWAYNEGITTGYPELMLFGSNDNVTREQLAVFLYRYADMRGMDVTVRADITGYLGYSEISDYAKEAISWAVGTGLISGIESVVDGEVIYNLAPQGSATRAQLATILMRFSKYYHL